MKDDFLLLNFFKKISFAVFVLIIVVGFFGVLYTPFFAQAQVTNESVEQRQARLQAELDQTEKDIAQWQSILTQKKGETASIQRDADILNAQIQQAKLEIKARNIAIERLGKDINVKEKTIETLDAKIERGKESLSQLIRKTNEIDSFSTVEVALSGEDISEFFRDIDSFDSIKQSLRDLFLEIRDNKSQTEVEKEKLSTKKNQETDVKVAVETQKRQVEKNEAEKKELLKISKTQEKTYEQVLKERQKKASQIRAALFALRDTAAIPFGTALAYANVVSAKTGVRPAFLLAILTQETNLGENIGTCNRPGDPASKLWTAIMPGPSDLASGKSKRNDQAAFLRITSGLGLDPASVPLSCPWQGGWGGAMGPAQFIPTTWESKQSSIAAALGKSKVSPWEPQDAFMASGLYLSELGANSGTFTAERTAALKYYAGGAWNAKKNAFYGDGVMAKARNIQENMIDPLQNV
jgi:membrane-bound lytic murein transglycosylase B